MSQIIIGFTTEGATDVRFLSSIIQRTFVEVGLECRKEIEVIDPPVQIDKEKGNNFVEQALSSSKIAFEKGVMILCIHVDADADNEKTVFETRINHALKKVEDFNGSICKVLVPVVPVHMTEAWMLADKELLKDEIGTDISDENLEFPKNPESIANPKETIINAIRIAREHLPKKRRKDLTIAELYQPIGQKIDLIKLDNLPSYSKFKEAVRDAYKVLNYLQ